jgi:hypothetical protein
MIRKLNHRLECKDCGTIYLDIPPDVNGDTPIHCSSCSKFLGHWRKLEKDFASQGGHHGVFHMQDGQINRIDDAGLSQDGADVSALRAANRNDHEP